jgi:MATE family multidrug resistance protein
VTILSKIFVFAFFCCSVRVSNELGAGHPKAAKFSVVVVTLTSLLIGIIFMILIFVTKNDFPVLFTNSQEVMHAVTKLATLLALTMVLNSVQPVLSGKCPNYFSETSW